jgi:hypothetical protein
VAVANEIIQNLVESLRACGHFAAVTLGGGGDTIVPRAAVHYEGQDFFPADDRPAARYVRLRCRVVIHTRCSHAGEQAARELDLSAIACEALLADPYRSGRCRDLPIGKATEIGRVDVGSTSRPEVETSFAVRCHFELPEGEP